MTIMAVGTGVKDINGVYGTCCEAGNPRPGGWPTLKGMKKVPTREWVWKPDEQKAVTRDVPKDPTPLDKAFFNGLKVDPSQLEESAEEEKSQDNLCTLQTNNKNKKKGKQARA